MHSADNIDFVTLTWRNDPILVWKRPLSGLESMQGLTY